jgi:LmbE family N-acetylglucosaminyl deacetylase
MHKLRLLDRDKKEFSILCLGAHGDDIEIGCGGTILRLLEECPNFNVQWVIFSCVPNQGRRREARNSAKSFLQNAKKRIVIKDFRDGFFPFVGDQVKEYFEQLKNEISPDLIFTHHRNDLHQDHRLLSGLTWNTFRDNLILEYEIPKYDGGLGSPNFFVPLSERVCSKKVEYLLKYFGSQKAKHWFTKDVFLSMLRVRGLECNSPSNYAEAFYSHKLII